MSTMQQQFSRLAKAMIIYGLGSGLNQFILFLLLPLFTNFLTPKEYGISAILGLISTLVTSIFSLGLGTAIVPVYFELKDLLHRANTIWTTFILLLISTMVVMITSIIFSSNFSFFSFQTTEYQHIITISMLTTCLSIISLPFTQYLQFEERVKLFVTLNLATSLISTGISVIMVVILRRGIKGWVEGGLIAKLIAFVIFILPVAFNLKFKINFKMAHELLRLGIPMIPSFAFIFILQETSRYVLQLFQGLEVLGIYSIGTNLGMFMAIPVGAFTTAWTPFFMSFINKREEARFLFGRILTYYVFGFGFLTLLFFIFSRPVTMIMTQSSFHEGYKVIGLSALAQTLIGVYSILLPGMYFAKEIHAQVLIQIGASVVSVCAAFILIPTLNLVGAALSLVFGYLAMAVFTNLWNMKRKGVYLSVKYEWPRIFIFIPILIIYIFGIYPIEGLSLNATIVVSIVELIFLIPVFFVLINKNERQEMVKLFSKAIQNLNPSIAKNNNQ